MDKSLFRLPGFQWKGGGFERFWRLLQSLRCTLKHFRTRYCSGCSEFPISYVQIPSPAESPIYKTKVDVIQQSIYLFNQGDYFLVPSFVLVSDWGQSDAWCLGNEAKSTADPDKLRGSDSMRWNFSEKASQELCPESTLSVSDASIMCIKFCNSILLFNQN